MREKIIAKKWRDKGEMVERDERNRRGKTDPAVPEAGASAGLFTTLSPSLLLMSVSSFTLF